MGIGHRLQRRKGFGRNDEQRLSGFEVANRFDQIRAVNVRNESKGHRALAVVLERLVCHDRAQIRSADPDIDDVTNALAGVAAPLAAPNAIREIGHLVQDSVYFWNDVFAIYNDYRVTRRAQRDVEHGPIFGDIDLFTPEHSIDPGSETSSLSELNQQGERFASDAVLGVIQENASGLGGHTFTALWVVAEKVTEMEVADFLVMCCQGFPCLALGERCSWCGHDRAPFYYSDCIVTA